MLFRGFVLNQCIAQLADSSSTLVRWLVMVVVAVCLACPNPASAQDRPAPPQTPEPAPQPGPPVPTPQPRPGGGGSGGGPISFDNGAGPGIEVFGNSQHANVKRIAFVVDASGSMVEVLPFVVREVRRVIRELSTVHHVTIICYSGYGIFEVTGEAGQQGLRPATPQFKQELDGWITLPNHRFPTGGRGAAHALDAIDLALSYQPQVVYLLSDNFTGGGQGASRFELDQQEVLDRIQQANARLDQRAKINTLQFLYQDPLVRAGLQPTLQRIAEQTHGNYIFVDKRRLGLR